jgi:uncharacterized protein YjiS (DUF1127 family)
MQPTLQIRRHDDGSIDHGFYRRRAVRRRRLVRRLLVQHCWAAAGRLAHATVLALRPALFRASRLITALARWWRVHADRRRQLRAMAMLGAMPDHALKDIGVSRSEIYWAVSHGRQVLPASARGRARQDLPASPATARPHTAGAPPRRAKEFSRAA